MTKKRPIDLEAVRLARANLRQIAREHPELLGEPGAGNREGWEATLEEAMAPKENDAQLVVRLPLALMARIDAYAERLREEQPGPHWKRADVARMLLVRALDEAEKAPKKSKR